VIGSCTDYFFNFHIGTAGVTQWFEGCVNRLHNAFFTAEGEGPITFSENFMHVLVNKFFGLVDNAFSILKHYFVH